MPSSQYGMQMQLGSILDLQVPRPVSHQSPYFGVGNPIHHTIKMAHFPWILVSILHEDDPTATGITAGTATSGGATASQTDDLTFMRGIVMTDREGMAIFETVYPGTYSGRTPHIHVKVCKCCEGFPHRDEERWHVRIHAASDMIRIHMYFILASLTGYQPCI